jgi:hypothetical protein
VSTTKQRPTSHCFLIGTSSPALRSPDVRVAQRPKVLSHTPDASSRGRAVAKVARSTAPAVVPARWLLPVPAAGAHALYPPSPGKRDVRDDRQK